ncbi:hypothetical protein [Pseudomonas monteilii]|uniref:Nucleotidyltransferase n=1 Tax=Pseudomonas monteilii TaxID=76759 RepID=A0A399M5F5_9PSED|nr:hypothetical protein [Pseudomonas monteilii]RII76597.1 hypothetical protein D0894_15650 [Pseudomonas monteilii]
MSTQEKRYPRERLTKQLIRICEVLDNISTRDIDYRIYDRPASCRLTVNEVWVVGSYARGALMCGDLDVVVRYTKVSGAKPNPKVYPRAFFGSPRGVSFFDGDPHENSSNVAFTDAVLIWSEADGKEGLWSSRINGIAPDPEAGRASRDSDCIPLRPEQLRIHNDALEKAVLCYQQRELEWEFFALDDVLLRPIPEAGLPQSDAWLVEFAKGMTAKNRELIPAVWRVATQTESGGVWSEAIGERATLRCGSTLIHIGTPTLTLQHFDSVKTRQLMLVPHSSSRGPRGIWLIRRGPKHPHVLGFKNRKIFYLGKPGVPDLIRAEHEFGDVRIFEFFESFEQASATAEEMYTDASIPVVISHAQDEEIFELLARADVLEFQMAHTAVTDLGRSYLQQEKKGDDREWLVEIAAVLPDTTATIE